MAVAARKTFDLVCLSHLRWDWVWQRPQHLLSRCARHRRVFYVEEAIFDGETRIEVNESESGVHVVKPHVPAGLSLRDASVVLGCSAVACRVRYHRAKSRLASRLEAAASFRPEPEGVTR